MDTSRFQYLALDAIRLLLRRPRPASTAWHDALQWWSMAAVYAPHPDDHGQHWQAFSKTFRYYFNRRTMTYWYQPNSETAFGPFGSLASAQRFHAGD